MWLLYLRAERHIVQRGGCEAGGPREDIRQSYNVWVDLVDPIPPGLLRPAVVPAALLVSFKGKHWILAGKE